MNAHENSFNREFWEERYGAPGLAWSGNPNPVLVTEARTLAPGLALDVGCGEGADTLWLAQHGWRVTGVDFAANALQKARAHAESIDQDSAARIDWERRDLTEWSPEPRSFDLVLAQFMHLPEPAMSTLLGSLAAAVAPGGTLLVVGHDASDFDANSEHRAHLREKMFSVDDVLAAIKNEDLQVEIAESRRRHDAPGKEGEFVHDIVVKASRANH